MDKNVVASYCTKCGWFTVLEYNENSCPYCGYTLKHYDCKTKNYNNLLKDEKYFIQLYVLYLIKSSAEFDADLHDQYLAELKEYKNSIESNKKVRCPNCHSTRIEKLDEGEKALS